ncbi:cryptochrome/photolyase family protein [Sedimentimonas flavescens]|uniref:cryptochrome/photolyase family protein n=1 Tax=Sedimentimonas flavescens TaxID=2851012 RepID=UPI0021A5FFB0|nr:deoxyribodipyrimidine photo-lyase [Sedimentimonas flavescens]MCT2538940.1 DNA photolyase family protein [Sedimentimonas flavescens]
MDKAPLIIWFRRDLRLHDHPALQAAVAAGRPIVPLFILDPQTEALGAAPKWRLGEGLAAFARALEGLGSRLILRRGPALEVLRSVIAETGAEGVHWSRLYDPEARLRDSAVKSALRAQGHLARSFPGHLLFEPWEVETKGGGPYRVYSPFWRAVQGRALAPVLPAVERLEAPARWPHSERLADWHLGAAMNRGAQIVGKYARVGEARALARLARFLDERLDGYAQDRDFPAKPGTSGLSENLTLGEISPRTIWHAAWRRLYEGAPGAETFLKELVWREFAWHLYYHFPEMARANWRAEWDAFPWRGDNADAEAWRRGMTGEPFVDAAMREMFTTGTMHNRARMIAASYLTKHLLTDWRVGLRWFQECLIDWDPASNAMGWQWVAGSGPDAAPYFRIFNPAGQAEKFDPEGSYRNRFLAEGQRNPPDPARDFFSAVPRSWRVTPDAVYPERLVSLDAGRARALAAYQGLRG